MKRLAVLTSGGDAPGMNAAIRSVVRFALDLNLQVYAVYGGYRGLIDPQVVEVNSRSVSNIIQRGGTILRTSREPRFQTEEGLSQAKRVLESFGIDGLITIGGDGTFRGAIELGRVWGGQIIGMPGTIDNDLWGTDATIGFETAVNTAVDAIDKIRDTAEAHERIFLVEVMGREAGFIALRVAVATGAEEVVVPEIKTEIRAMSERLSRGRVRGKTSSIIVVAEGSPEGGAYQIAEKLKEISGSPYHVVILGHLLRGGCPCASDRILATKLGAYAVKAFLAGENGVMVGESDQQLRTVPLPEVVGNKKPLPRFLLEIFRPLGI